ncbi:MAG: cbb3-type cytochrome c oxidase subunit I [Saprospiraceae bacterium]|nr:cbb3-type cytochrome c oxidase subunit I [Saprospiraceae bacterium]
MSQINSTDFKKQKNLIALWSYTFLIIFPLLIILGLLMRLNQGEVIDLGIDNFYVVMTLHGLGMAGLLYSMAFGALWYLLASRYVKLNIKVGYFIYTTVIIGVVGLVIATLIGKFGAGWYLLYPLPFKGTFWPGWATALSIISLILLGIAWLIGNIHVVYALARNFGGLANIIGWQYLGRKKVDTELPPVVLIAAISLIPGVIAFLAGAVFLIMFLLQNFEPGLNFDNLLVKNLIFFFGHTLVNITLYCCLGWVYALLPEYSGREWKVNKLLVYSWNATFFFILFAYFHHLYMDFVQPKPLHIAGQLASYFSAIPATAVTMFGVISQIYRSKIRWTIVPTTFLLGVAGWAIGGFAAVVDSTIAINKILHNTLWVPAHFHTYMLTGVVLFLLGFLFHLTQTKDEQVKDKLSITGFWTFLIAAHCFVASFYAGGLNSIPRRYSDYTGIPMASTHSTGATLAAISTIFIYILLIGLLIMYFSIFKNLRQWYKNPSKT